MFKNFELNNVVLEDLYFKKRSDLVKEYIKNFDIERLMYTFKKNAGIKTDALPLGGWESEECGLRGHFVGHFLSACSKFAFYENDADLKDKSNQIVDIMKMCVKENGYLSAFGEDVIDTLEREENRDVWAPYYVLHKIMQGLIDCFVYLNNKDALKLATDLADYIISRFEKLSYWKIDGILRCTKVNPVNEFGGIGDALYSLYEITKNEKYLNIAKLFDRDYFIENISNDRDVLTNLHANTHLPMAISAIHRYNITGEEKYKKVAINFYDYVLQRTFANGNSSSKAENFIEGGVSQKAEHWGKRGYLADALTGGESESCCAHNTEKIAEEIFKWSGNIDILNHIEILKYNAVLNSASEETGLSQYHQPMGMGVKKSFSTKYDSFWCCTGSGIEAMSEIKKNIWFKSEDSILINMFVNSKVNWEEKSVTINQITQYPDTMKSVLTINTLNPVEFTIFLKKKYIKSVKLNGLECNTKEHNGFITIKKIFNNNDKIEIDINMQFKLVSLLGDDTKKAIMCNNILLAQIGKDKWIHGITEENISQKLIKKAGNKLAFVIDGISEERFKLVPLYSVFNEEYSVYLPKAEYIDKNNNSFNEAKNGRQAYEG